jgi:hypothetical protein
VPPTLSPAVERWRWRFSGLLTLLFELAPKWASKALIATTKAFQEQHCQFLAKPFEEAVAYPDQGIYGGDGNKAKEPEEGTRACFATSNNYVVQGGP